MKAFTQEVVLAWISFGHTVCRLPRAARPAHPEPAALTPTPDPHLWNYPVHKSLLNCDKMFKMVFSWNLLVLPSLHYEWANTTAGCPCTLQVHHTRSLLLTCSSTCPIWHGY
jgi:hypothetical protein